MSSYLPPFPLPRSSHLSPSLFSCRDGDSVSTHSAESDSGVSGHLTGDVALRASTLPANGAANNRVSTLSTDGDDEGKKKKNKGFGSFLKKKKDKS